MRNNGVAISIRANNQITLKYGNYRIADKPIYHPIEKELIGYEAIGAIKQSDYERCLHDANKAHSIAAKYNQAMSDRKSLGWTQNPSLDLITKSQRGFEYAQSRINKPKSFTKASGQKIRESGAAIDKLASDARFTHCVTLTLPANHIAAYRALAAYSSYAINRLFQPIRRRYGNDVLWFFVWEYQKRGALHLHIAIYHPDESEGLWISAQLIDQWHKILCDISELAATDMFLSKDGKTCKIRALHQHHAQPMKKSLGAYFAKYAGKTESKNDWYVRKYPVSRFWGSSYSLKKIVADMSYEFSLYVDWQDRIDEIVEKVLQRIASENLSVHFERDFDISIAYESRNRLSIAKGKMMSFYCSSADYERLRGDIQAICEEYF